MNIQKPQTEQECKEFAQKYELFYLMKKALETNDKRYIQQIKNVVRSWDGN